jgi:tRNA uridine 5-carboxymethylaminomethyl modification enzyme
MFTSRAEHRLLLREDNADLRLTEIGRRLGVVDDRRWQAFETQREAIERESQRLKETWVRPAQVSEADIERVLQGPLAHESRALDLLRRPEVDYAGLMSLPGVGPGAADPRVAEQVEIQAKYAGYIERQHADIARQRRHEQQALPPDLDYAEVHGLSQEAREKLNRHRPHTLGQASRVPGVTPATLSLLLVHLKRGRVQRSSG